MKFKINRDHFSAGLSQLVNLVNPRAPMPILGNVLIDASGEGVQLTTTNLDLGMSCRIQAEVQETGKITLPARKLAAIVQDLPHLDVEVTVDENNRVRLVSGNSNYKLSGLPADDFPPLATFEGDHTYVLQQEQLQQMLKSVAYAQSQDENRYIMNGVYFNYLEDRLVLAATDGRRLALMGKEMEIGEANTGNFILPAKAVTDLMRILNKGDKVKIAFNEKHVAFDVEVKDTAKSGLIGGVHLLSKIVEGRYPNYQQVIPKESEWRIIVERDLLEETVRRVSYVLTEKSNAVTLKASENMLEIVAESPELGQANESIAVKYDGPEVKVAFNPEFIREPLKNLVRDEVMFEFKNELSPGVIRTEDNFLCVIMPLRG